MEAVRWVEKARLDAGRRPHVAAERPPRIVARIHTYSLSFAGEWWEWPYEWTQVVWTPGATGGPGAPSLADPGNWKDLEGGLRSTWTGGSSSGSSGPAYRLRIEDQPSEGEIVVLQPFVQSDGAVRWFIEPRPSACWARVLNVWSSGGTPWPDEANYPGFIAHVTAKRVTDAGDLGTAEPEIFLAATPDAGTTWAYPNWWRAGFAWIAVGTWVLYAPYRASQVVAGPGMVVGQILHGPSAPLWTYQPD
jgi:hypothetical protein